MIRNLCKMAMICTMLSYISCTKDYVEKPVEKTRAVPVSLFLASQDDTANETRAGVQVAEDAQVKTMDLLIFDESNLFMKRVKVIDALLQQTQTGVNFMADLDITNKKRTIHFIANGRTTSGQDRLNFNEITERMPMATVFQKLKALPLANETSATGTTMAQHIMPLVMWSQRTLDSGITPNTSIRDLKLLRAAAAVQVKVSNSVTGLTISRMTLLKSVTTGYVAPQNINTVQIPESPNHVIGAEFLHHDRSWVNGAASTLYTYERNSANSSPVEVLIDATYNNVRGYYKVTLMKDDHYACDVVRNHRYIVTITGVNAPGYANINDAINAPSANNRLTVTINDEASEFPFVTADGKYYMGLTNSQVTVYKQKEVAVELCKVYSSNDKQPTVTGVASSLVKNIQVTKEKTNVYKVSATIAHPSNAVETTTATITCGNLSLPLKITNNKNKVGSADANSYVLDLLESSDRNWMVDIKTNTAYMKLSGTLSSAGNYPEKESEMTNSLSDKYWRKAYLHVKTSMSSEGTLFMTGSNASSEPFARKIIVRNN